MNKLFVVVALSALASGCKYSNQFQGTFEGQPATLSAYSKNVNKYCVYLEMNSGSVSKPSYISAYNVIDPNDLLKPMTFNSKGTECNTSETEFLTGNRNAIVKSLSQVSRRESVGMNYCRIVTYQRYHYQEDIYLEYRNIADDSVTGTFKGLGQLDSYVDYSKPLVYGPMYYCGTYDPRYPYPRIGPHFYQPRI